VTTAFLGAKQEDLAIVNFLNKLIISCKEAVWIPIYFIISCRIIVYVLNSAVPSNVKRMSLVFKISKINLEYVAIFLTEIPQCLQKRHRGFLAFLTYDVMKLF
jgi:hypothetical protein